jgi:hypothetical protein
MDCRSCPLRQRVPTVILAPLGGNLPLLFSLVWCYLIVSELREPYVGPAIRDELGISYVVQSYLLALLPLAFIAWPLFRRTAKALSCAL